LLKCAKVLSYTLLLAGSVTITAAEQVHVPLAVDLPHLRGEVASALGLDADGNGALVADHCNRLELSKLELVTIDDTIGVALELTGYSGAEAFGRCRGPKPWVGQVRLQLQPLLERGGVAVAFEPSAAELRRSDGSKGLLTRPTRLLAETLIVPRMETVRIDVAEPLAAIDGLIELFLEARPEQPSPLTERGRLTAVEVVKEGLRATLTFGVTPPLIVDGDQADPVEAATEALQNGVSETTHDASEEAVVAESKPASSPGDMPDDPPLEAVTVPVVAETRLDDAELQQWQRIEDELDGFLTVIIMQLAGQAAERGLQIDLLGTLLDTRQRIAEALTDDNDSGEDPVRRLFLNAWEQLKPLLGALSAQDHRGSGNGLRLAGFIAAGDALQLVDALGPEFGLEISRDGLRRLARLLLADDAPAAFTPLPLQPDPKLQQLFGFPGTVPLPPMPPPQSLLLRLAPIPRAHASELTPAQALRGMVPQLAIIDEYLNVVSRLLKQSLASHLDGSRLAANQRTLFDPLVRATAWKETCWRHYIGRKDELEVIRSAMGAVGMMQILGRVWRSVYDIQLLEDDVEYNVAAGIEILEHYFLDYAVRREEHKQPGGMENLVRATYAAYNGGPSQLSRYRRDDTSARAKAVDREFFRHFQEMKTSRWPEVSSCYAT